MTIPSCFACCPSRLDWMPPLQGVVPVRVAAVLQRQLVVAAVLIVAQRDELASAVR
jgi:hypothetical protein